MLAIQKYIKTYGLKKAIQTFKLTYKDKYNGRYLLKYKQIDSPFDKEEVCDCRGLILDSKTHDVISLGFRKFFNVGETNAVSIDWDNALIYPKLDGSFIQLYNYNNVWYAGTTGTAEGEGQVHDIDGFTFADLFWKAFNIVGGNYNTLDPSYIYMFELTTPDIIVVANHTTYSITLLGVRCKNGLQEVNIDKVTEIANLLNVPVVKPLQLPTNYNGLRELANQMPSNEEGYVVCDNNFNRVKIKSPAYVAAHHLKSSNKTHDIIEIFKKNEFEEWEATHKGETTHLYQLYFNWLEFYDNFKDMYNFALSIKPQSIDKKSQKVFAGKIFSKLNSIPLHTGSKYNMAKYASIMFNIRDGKYTTDDFTNVVQSLDNKKIYKLLKND